MTLAIFAALAGMLFAPTPYPFHQGQLCRAAVSLMLSVPVQNIRLTDYVQGVSHVALISEENQPTWALKCRLSGNKIAWSADIQRWGDKRWWDNRLTYGVFGQTLTVTEHWPNSDTTKSASFTPYDL